MWKFNQVCLSRSSSCHIVILLGYQKQLLLSVMRGVFVWGQCPQELLIQPDLVVANFLRGREFQYYYFFHKC
jgi:hypothetical protein